MKKVLFFFFAVTLFSLTAAVDPYSIRRGIGVRPARTIENRSMGEQVAELKFRLPRGVMLSLVKIKAGDFVFGAEKENGKNQEKGVLVSLKNDFYIGKFEITQAQYQAVTGKNPSLRKNSWDYPVENVSWNEAMFFCERMTKYLAPKGWKFTLPTECQWEYAAAVSGVETGKSSAYSGSDDIHEVCWFDDNAGNKTHPVGKKIANHAGIYDMCGNVWEWCLDNWNANLKKIVPEFTRRNDKNLQRPRVLRGGSYRDGANWCRSVARQSKSASYRHRSIGFRVCLVQLPGNTNLNPVGNADGNKK